jgi:ketosteroid isomerase-like protein
VGALLALGAAGASASAGEVEQAVLAAQDQRIKLLIAADVAKLGAAMTDDLTWTHSSAVVETKAEFLDAIKTGKYKYKGMAFDERRVRLHGDATAIVSGTTRVQVVTGGREIDVTLRFTELYVKAKDGWKMALWHSTRVPD